MLLPRAGGEDSANGGTTESASAEERAHISDTSGVAGGLTAAAEHASGTASIGSNFRFYANPFYGNQSVKFTVFLAEGFRALGVTSILIGTAADGARLANGEIGAAHFGANTAMGLAAFDFPVGSAASLGYFAVEATVGWDHVDFSRDVGAPQFPIP